MLGLERVQQLRVVRLTGYRSVVIDLELLDRELQSLRIFRRIPDVTCVVAEIAETGLNARHLGHRIEVADPQRKAAEYLERACCEDRLRLWVEGKIRVEVRP